MRCHGWNMSESYLCHCWAKAFFKKIIFKIYLFLVAPGLCCGMGFPLVVESGNYSLVMVLRLPILVASPVVEHGLSGPQASAAATRGSAVVAPGL